METTTTTRDSLKQRDHLAEPSAETHHHFVQIETPKTAHDASKFHAQAPKFTLEWKHLSLKVK
ncbi:Atp-binding protein, partial [Globisporangium polare]